MKRCKGYEVGEYVELLPTRVRYEIVGFSKDGSRVHLRCKSNAYSLTWEPIENIQKWSDESRDFWLELSGPTPV